MYFIKKWLSKTGNSYHLTCLLFFAVQHICGQQMCDSLLQRRIDTRMEYDKMIMQDINDSGRSDWEQRLQKYEKMLDYRYQRLAKMGDPVAIALVKSSDAGRKRTRTSPPKSEFDFYVSTKGSDNNPGTKRAPFRTIQKAIDVSSESLIRIEDGIYMECIDVADKYIILTGNAYNPQAVVINGTGNGTVVSVSGSYFEINGVMITGGNSGNQTVINIKDDGTLITRNVIIAENNSNKAIIAAKYLFSSVYLVNTLIYGNHVDGGSYNGVIVASECDISLINTTVTDNIAPATFVQEFWCNNKIHNSILYNRQSKVEIKDFANNSLLDVAYCNIRNHSMLGIEMGIGVIDVDPKNVGCVTIWEQTVEAGYPYNKSKYKPEKNKSKQ
jgi:hypothetical protein